MKRLRPIYSCFLLLLLSGVPQAQENMPAQHQHPQAQPGDMPGMKMNEAAGATTDFLPQIGATEIGRAHV